MPDKKPSTSTLPSKSSQCGGDETLGFNAKLSLWRFRILAEKTILAVVHSGKYAEASQWCAPRDGTHGLVAALPCVAWEKRRVWMVEATPTGYRRPYAYSKRILYMDQDFFFPVLTEMYDQQGEFWKSTLHGFFFTTEPYAGYPATPLAGAKYHYTEEQPFASLGLLIDFQHDKIIAHEAPPSAKLPSEWKTEWYYNEDVASNTSSVHSTNYLR